MSQKFVGTGEEHPCKECHGVFGRVVKDGLCSRCKESADFNKQFKESENEK